MLGFHTPMWIKSFLMNFDELKKMIKFWPFWSRWSLNLRLKCFYCAKKFNSHCYIFLCKYIANKFQFIDFLRFLSKNRHKESSWWCKMDVGHVTGVHSSRQLRGKWSSSRTASSNSYREMKQITCDGDDAEWNPWHDDILREWTSNPSCQRSSSSQS